MGMDEVDDFLNDFLKGRRYRAEEAAEIIDITVEELKCWEDLGIVTSVPAEDKKQKGRGYYSTAIRNAKLIKMFIERGYSLEKADAKLKELS